MEEEESGLQTFNDNPKAKNSRGLKNTISRLCIANKS